MKKLVVYLGLVMYTMMMAPACSKSGGGGGNCDEPAVKFTSSPALNSVETPATGPDFPLTVNVSPLPDAGVTITVSAKPEAPASAANFFDQTISSTSAVNNFTITGTPLATSAIVTITVTSKGCSTNKSSGTYRYSRK